MNKNKKFQKKVIKPAVKASKKYKKKHKSIPDKNNIGHLKIQTANIFVRIITGVFGLILVSGGIFLMAQGNYIIGIILFFAGVVFFILGIRGRKRELESVMDSIDIIDGIELVIEAISEIDIDF